MGAILALVGQFANFLAREGKAWLRWVRQQALLAARAARALVVWVGAHLTARTALLAAGVLAFETFTVFVAHNAITPLASSFIRTCIPSGSAGDGLVWLLWDTGLNGKAFFEAAVVYVANYTALWRAFDVWLRAQAIALSTYKAALRTAKAVRDATILR